MGRKLLFLIAILGMVILQTSCATVLGGAKTKYQDEKPLPECHRREIRDGFLIMDILFTGGVGIIIDFWTEKIYEKAPDKNFKTPC